MLGRLRQTVWDRLVRSGWLNWDLAFWLMLAALTVALIALAASIHVFLAGDPVTSYAPTAQALLRGVGISVFAGKIAGGVGAGPLFPTAVAGVALFFGGHVFPAGLVVDGIGYVLFVIGTFAVVRAAFGPRLAFFTAAVVGTNAAVLHISVSWLTDVLFAALALLSLWCMLAPGRRVLWAALGAGLFAGLALDTRWTALFLIGVAVLAAALNPWRLRLPRLGAWLGLFGLGFLLAAGPWLLVNWAVHGSPFYNQLNQAAWNTELLPPGVSVTAQLKDVILTDPVSFFWHYSYRWLWTGLFDVNKILPLILVFFMPAGALVLLKQLDRRRSLLLVFSGVYWSLAILTHYEARFYFLMLPLLLLLPLLFLLSEAVPDIRLLSGRLSLKLCLVAAALLLVCAHQYQGAQASTASTNRSFLAQPEAAKLLAEQPLSQPGQSRVGVQYYSGARFFIPEISGLPISILGTTQAYLQPPPDYAYVFAEASVPTGARDKPPDNIFNPLSVGAQLEAIYLKTDKPQAVLYRVLTNNKVWPTQAITVSAALDDKHAAPAALDGDAQTGWLTPVADQPEAPAMLTVDLGQVRTLDRVWLLPPPDPALFPEAYQIEASPDGAQWMNVGQAEHEALNQHQNPRVFAFPRMSARYVRFIVLRRRPGPGGQYQAGLNALRVSLSQPAP